MEDNCGVTSGEKFEGMASWVGASLASVFFASLERFSCINLATTDRDEDLEEDAKERPLMLSVQNSSVFYRSDAAAFAPKFAPVWAPPSHQGDGQSSIFCTLRVSVATLHEK